RILQLNDRGEFSWPGRPRNITVYLRSHCIESKRTLLDAGHVGLDQSYARVDGNLGLCGQFRVPECIEVWRPRRREPESAGGNGGPNGVKAVVAARIAAYERGCGGGAGVRRSRCPRILHRVVSREVCIGLDSDID